MMMMSSIDAVVDGQEFMEKMNNHGRLELMDYEVLKKTEEEEKRGEIIQVLPFSLLVPKKKRSCPLVILAAKALLSLSQTPPFNFKTELGNQNVPKTSLTVQSSDSFAAMEKDCFKNMNQNPGKFKKRGRDNLQEEEAETRKKKKKKFRKDKKKDALMVQVIQPPLDLPQELKNYIDCHMLGGGTLAAPPVFVIQKALTKTDLSSGHNRLSMPHTRINREFLENFLTEDEKTKLQYNRHIQVNLIDPSMHEYNTLQFTCWPMSKTSVYVLVTDWNTVWNDNRLEEGMTVQIWSFRVKSNTISFALAVQRN